MRQSKRLLLVSLLLGLVPAGPALAVPAPPHPLEVRQAGAGSLRLRFFGDEHGLFAEAEDGYTVVPDASGTWRYAARGAGGRLAPTSLAVGRGDPAALGVPRGLRHDDAVMRQIDDARRAAAGKLQRHPRLRGPAGALRGAAPGGESALAADLAGALGAPATFRLAVIPVEFPAEGASPAVPHTYSPQQLHDLLFSSHTYTASPLGSPVRGSMRDYYEAVSYGRFQLTGQVLPWARLPRGKPHYDADSGTLEADALAVSGLDPSQFDAFVILTAGPPGSSGLWPHAMGTHYVTSEMFDAGADLSFVGVHCHEFGHLLGLKDLYYGQGAAGYWTLMASGSYGGNGASGYLPVQLLGMEKEMLGWLEPVTVGAGAHPALLLPPVADTGVVYRVLSRRSAFYLEYRKKSGYDALIPGQGLSIWHVDMTQSSWTGDPAPYRFDLEEADGVPAYGGSSRTLFPGDLGASSFGCSTVPSSADYDGSCSVELQNISEGASGVTLDAQVTWGAGVGITVDGSGDYPSLFTAVNAAAPGQTVRVPAGTFQEKLIMRPGVHVAGAGPGRSVLQAVPEPPSGYHPMMVQGAEGSTLSGFTLRGANYLSQPYGQEGFGYEMADLGFTSARISNCAFVGFLFGVNTSNSGAYGWPWAQGVLEVTNSVFQRNTTALAIWYNGRPTIRNNVVTGNQFGVQRVYDTAPTGSVAYNDLYGNEFDQSNLKPGELGAGNISADPLFVDAAAGDFRLRAGSPAIDAGDPAPAQADRDGSRNDMGAFGGPLAPAEPLAISTAALPGATVGTAYSQALGRTGGLSPFTWTIAAGSLPPGLSLSASTGIVSGTPSVAGTSTFTVRVADAAGSTASKPLSIAVAAGGRPDLVLTAVSGPSSGTRGRKVTVSATVRNQGTAAAGASTLTLYLSTDATITTADAKLGDVSVAGLAAGASRTVSASLTLPNSLSRRTYTFGAIADRANAVAESNEGNNARAGNAISVR